MNKNIFNAFIVGSVAMSLASCSENSWNNHYLDGFESGVDYEDAIEATYTITASDYSTIASLMGNVASTDEEKTAAKAIGKNLYFNKTGVYPAQVALPEFFDSSSFAYYYASNGSTVDVTYQEAANVPAKLYAIAGASTYNFSKADYQTAWGSEEDFINGFAPMLSASSNIPSILASAYPAAADGSYVVVSYNEASENPIFSTENSWEMTSVIGGVSLNDDVEIRGLVTAINSRGFILTDASGSILCYQASGFSVDNVEIGSQVVLKGKIGAYNKGFQVAITSESYSVGSTSKYTYPEAKKYTGAMLDEFVAHSSNELAEFVSIDCSASVSGNYYNFNVDGAETAVGSGYMVPDNIRALISDGGNYTISGYLITVSGGRYANIVITDVQPLNASKSAGSRAAVVAVPTTAKNAVYVYSAGEWSEADDEIAILNPADYTAMGVKENKLLDPEIYIPLYLKNKFIYAQSGDQKYVVYNGTKVDIFVFDGSVWTLNNNGLETVTGRFVKKNNVWSFVKYVGKAIFDEFTEAQIVRDRSYLIVSGDICATPVDKSNNYGYFYTASISVSNGQIVTSSDANAFTFASSFESDGTVVAAPEGQFLLRDSNNRYAYMSGTYSSANMSAAPIVNDGAIDSKYLWTATSNGDGTWSISNVGNNRVMAYSSNYASFGVYENIGDTDVFPSLYILNE